MKAVSQRDTVFRSSKFSLMWVNLFAYLVLVINVDKYFSFLILKILYVVREVGCLDCSPLVL